MAWLDGSCNSDAAVTCRLSSDQPLLGHLQRFLTPESIHPVRAHHVALTVEEHPNGPVRIARICGIQGLSCGRHEAKKITIAAPVREIVLKVLRAFVAEVIDFTEIASNRPDSSVAHVTATFFCL